VFLIIIGPLVAIALWLFTNKTRIGKISRAAAVDREMVGVLGINVSWVFAMAFVIGCSLAGLGGALIAPTVNITLGMDHSLIIEAFLIVTIGGLGNMWGALAGSLIWCDSIPGGIDLASIRYCFALRGSRDCSPPEAKRAA
jgi:branched-subunit amino acid ABC-type transport system permease component